MQTSLNSPHAMGPSMSPVGSPYMTSSVGMSGGAMTQCMGSSMAGPGTAASSSRDYFGDPGSPRSRSVPTTVKCQRNFVEHNIQKKCPNDSWRCLVQ